MAISETLAICLSPLISLFFSSLPTLSPVCHIYIKRLRGMLSGSRSFMQVVLDKNYYEWFRTRLHSPQLQSRSYYLLQVHRQPFSLLLSSVSLLYSRTSPQAISRLEKDCTNGYAGFIGNWISFQELWLNLRCYDSISSPKLHFIYNLSCSYKCIGLLISSSCGVCLLSLVSELQK